MLSVRDFRLLVKPESNMEENANISTAPDTLATGGGGEIIWGNSHNIYAEPRALNSASCESCKIIMQAPQFPHAVKQAQLLKLHTKKAQSLIVKVKTFAI